MLTARAELKDRLKGLGIGADDYMTKPFHLDELLLRVKGMFRRKKWYQTSTIERPIFQLGKFTIRFDTLTCKSDDAEFKLTSLEAMLLRYLIENKGRIVSRKELLANVWQTHSDMETRTVDIFIARLRKAFEINPKRPKYFISVRSKGYIFSGASSDS
jgi:DNA-binding response OmpR family regulator